MSEGEGRQTPSVLELQEELMQHMEAGSRKIRGLAVVGLGVSVVIALAYVSQLVLPLATGTTSVQVSLTDPVLVVTEVVVLILALAWAYNSLREYLFTTRMNRQIREIRKLEHELAQKHGIPEGNEV